MVLIHLEKLRAPWKLFQNCACYFRDLSFVFFDFLSSRIICTHHIHSDSEYQSTEVVKHCTPPYIPSPELLLLRIKEGEKKIVDGIFLHVKIIKSIKEKACIFYEEHPGHRH